MPFSSIIILFRMAAKPLPPSRWPIFAFIEPLPKRDMLVRVKVKSDSGFVITVYVRKGLAPPPSCDHVMSDLSVDLHIEWLFDRPATSEHPAYGSCFCHVSNLRPGAWNCQTNPDKDSITRNSP